MSGATPTFAVPERRRLPDRRDLARVAAAAASLVLVMTLTLGLDLTPGLDVKAGDLAPGDIKAPRALTFTNDILTAEAREAARAKVEPQYDYTSERAITIAAGQLSAFTRQVSPLDTAFAPETSAEERQALLDAVLPGLSAEARTVLQTLDAARWAPLKTEAARVLDVTERAELRDTEVAQARERLSAQMAGELSDGERQLAAELIAPLLVPNSSFSADGTQQERDRQAALVAPVVESIAQGEVLVRDGTKITEVDVARIKALGLDVQRPDVAAIGGWFLLS
ncbi:MAG: hypothetical protein ABI620_09295, partial [Chloroflexota bacterium]